MRTDLWRRAGWPNGELAARAAAAAGPGACALGQRRCNPHRRTGGRRSRRSDPAPVGCRARRQGVATAEDGVAAAEDGVALRIEADRRPLRRSEERHRLHVSERRANRSKLGCPDAILLVSRDFVVAVCRTEQQE